MATMRAMQISEVGGDFEPVERPVPEPGRGQVRVRVEACGICHSDAFVKEGSFPIDYPRIPGHEIAGRVDALGEGVSAFREGERVGVGWHGGHCGQCRSCRRGDFVTCENAEICGITYDGGYAEFVVVPQEAVARIPHALDPIEAAPLMCAGVTTYNALRHTGALPGDLVAVQGLGGLGHLAVQYASRMGFRTVALSRGTEKAELARSLGAHEYIDASKEGEPTKALQGMGGARVILSTAPNAKVMSEVVDGLSVNGKLLVVGASPDPIEVSPIQLLMMRRSVAGHPSGTPHDSEDTMSFSALTGIKTHIETYPLEQASEAYDRMINNRARFRIVLTTGADQSWGKAS